MLAISNKSIKNNYSIYTLKNTSFLGFKSENALEMVRSKIINAKTDSEKMEGLKQFRKRFDKYYAPGNDKLQNPKYHQYTVTDHMLKAMEEATKIVNGEHKKLNQLLSKKQQSEIKDIFKEKIAEIDKGTLFVMAMAFHDLDKLQCMKPKFNDEGKIWSVSHNLYPNLPENAHYWSANPKTEQAKELFNKIAKEINLQQPAVKYIHDVMEHHDNPLNCLVWEIENGRNNLTQLFDEMKEKTPFSLKELALIYLADQSGKGEEGWLDHLEKVSPWECIFNSLVAERPLEELNKLLNK